MSGILYAEQVGNSIELNATFSDKELARSIPGSKFHTPPPIWTVPLSWAACQQLRGTFGTRLEVGPKLRAWAEDELESRVKLAMAFREEATGGLIPVPPPAGRKLRPFQESDVRWMLAAQSGLLMNPVGSGKTISFLTWMRNMGLERGLVICPEVMRLVWQAECANWYPEIEAIPIIGTAGERRKLIQEVGDYGGLAIIGFASLRTHTKLAPYGQVRLTASEKQIKDLNLIDFEVVVADEAHRLKDPKSKWTRACWAVGKDAEYRWPLTATPQTKGLDTLWPALHFANPVEWPGRSKFIDRYCHSSLNFWGGLVVGALRPEMEKEFQAIFDPRSRRLPKEVVLPQLPPVVRILKELDMTKQQAEAYQQMAKLSLAEVEDGGVVVATSTAAQYTRLGQFASSFAHIEERMVNVTDKETGAKSPQLKEFVELNLPSNKIEAFLTDLEDWLAQDENVVAFAISRRLIMLLSEVLDKKKISHSLIVGGQGDMQRYEEIQKFQRGDVKVILVVIAAGGSGITLTSARIGAFLQRSWSRVDDIQAEGRFHRIGSEQHESVIRVDYVSKDTVDIGQLDVLASKEDMMQVILRDAETIKKIICGDHLN